MLTPATTDSAQPQVRPGIINSKLQTREYPLYGITSIIPRGYYNLGSDGERTALSGDEYGAKGK
jgi:hypothetical protein